MRGRKLSAALLLGVGLCFAPVLVYGEVGQCKEKAKVYLSPEDVYSLLFDYNLLKARVDYIMRNPTNFLNVNFYYDQKGMFTEMGLFPKDIDTEGEIVVIIVDNRDVFSDKFGTVLLDEFKKQLETIIDSSIILKTWATIPQIMKNELKELGVEMDADIDIVARFCSKWEISPPSPLPEEVCLGYFYQGEYHLWEK